ncbi:FecR family protein [Psychroflexus lacisalsi]|uniref:FecR family protein n=1 Tax=Psychroflexus lacisalsi TaxID=503928 RepID=A0ABN1K4F7_9FLAO|nr:FecR family protein [Psychroflexus lacisalsi]MBZ9618955.1 FecR family protein [Psychroflexus lacisalsi]
MNIKKEYLINKWLNNELTEEELKAFKKLDDYDSYMKISEKAKYFKCPDFNTNDSLKNIESNIKAKKSSSYKIRYQYLAAVAAILIVAFSIFKIFNNNSDIKTFKTEVAKTQTINLPDNSIVNLSANSLISFDNSAWDTKRNLTLEGEAFFDVEKGKKFTVETSYGKIQVLGTQFNVKARKYGFEVACYEGSVQINVDDRIYVLEEKNHFTLKNKNISKSKTVFKSPDWKRNSTILKSTSLDVVLKEFKNYYDVDFETSTVDMSRQYTGSFIHNDLENALKSITLPLDLTYEIKKEKVVLKAK